MTTEREILRKKYDEEVSSIKSRITKELELSTPPITVLREIEDTLTSYIRKPVSLPTKDEVEAMISHG